MSTLKTANVAAQKLNFERIWAGPFENTQRIQKGQATRNSRIPCLAPCRLQGIRIREPIQNQGIMNAILSQRGVVGGQRETSTRTQTQMRRRSKLLGELSKELGAATACALFGSVTGGGSDARPPLGGSHVRPPQLHCSRHTHPGAWSLQSNATRATRLLWQRPGRLAYRGFKGSGQPLPPGEGSSGAGWKQEHFGFDSGTTSPHLWYGHGAEAYTESYQGLPLELR